MARHKHPRKKPDINLTPMLDLVFQLIVFFLLVTNFSSAQLPPMEPPEPEDSQAYVSPDREKLIVNVLPEGASGRARSVRVGITQIEAGDYGELTRLLEDELARSEQMEVDLRADARIEYGNVRPVMSAITAAGISRINLVAFVDRDQPAAGPEGGGQR